MKKNVFSLFVLLIFSIQIYSQSNNLQFNEAKGYLNLGEFAKAYEEFMVVYNSPDVDLFCKSSSYFYSAECLIGLKEYSGALSILEDFVEKYNTVNLKEIALYRLGTIYYQQRDYFRSRERLKKLIKEFPESEYQGSAFYWIGKCYFAENKFSDAEEFLNEAITVGKNNRFIDYSIYTLANLYEENNDYSSAVTYYDELLAYHKGSSLVPYAQYRIGVCYFKLKEYDSAVLELSDPLIENLPAVYRTEALYLLANSHFRLKDYISASKIYNEIIKSNPNIEKTDKIVYGLGRVYFQMQNYEEAYKIFNRLSQVGTDTFAVNSLFWSAECRRYQGEENIALSIYDRFLTRYPKSDKAPAVKFNIGVIYYNRKELERAEEYLKFSINSDDNVIKAKAYTFLGEISIADGKFKEAIDYFVEAMAVPKTSDDLRNRSVFGLGIAYYYLDNYENAIINLTDLSIRFPKFERDKVNFFMAESYFQKNNYSNALKYYNNVEGVDSSIERQTLYGRAYAYFNLKDYANASYYFSEFINKYPQNEDFVDAKLRLADSYFGTKNFEKAATIYSEVFTKYKNAKITDFAYYQYGQSLFKAKKWKEAIQKFQTLQTKYPFSSFTDDAQYLIGWIYFQQGMFNDAVSNYQIIISNYPKSNIMPIAYYSLGDTYYNLAEYDSAIIYYNKILNEYSKTPQAFDAINGLQYCYIALDEPNKAITAIDRYTQNNPSGEFSDKILFKKGEIYYDIGKYEQARSGFKEFIATYSSSSLVPNAYYWIAKSSTNLRQLENAKYHYEIIISQYITSDVGVSAVLEMGKLYSKQNDFKSEVELYNSAIEKLPDSDKIPELLYAKALANVELLEIQSAYETFNQIITYHDGSIFAAKSKIEVGILEMNRGSFENAELLFKELGQNRTDDIGAQAQYYYGVTLFNQNKISDAISALVRVRSVFASYDEWYSRALIKLGDCYVKRKEKEKAKEMYNAVAKKQKDNELGKEAIRKLRKL